MNPTDSAPIEGDFELADTVPTSALEAITRGEIDIQIATAHKFPRSLAEFKKRACEMATIDEETAASCLYRKPVGKKDGKPQFAEGLSVRMAEIVMACYKNMRVAVMLLDSDRRSVKARGMCHDLEGNNAIAIEVVENTTYAPKPGQKLGDPYNDNMRTLIAKAAVAKARRDAIFAIVPKALARPIEAAVRALLAGDGKSLTKRRAIVMKWIKDTLKIDPARVFIAMGIKGEEDLTTEILDDLTGIRTAINDNETTVDECFPPISQEGRVGSTAPKTATEDAATAGQTPAPEKPKAEEPKGPKPAELRKTILAKIGTHNIGKARLMTELKAAKMVAEDAIFDQLDAVTLARIDDALDEIIERVTKPAE